MLNRSTYRSVYSRVSGLLTKALYRDKSLSYDIRAKIARDPKSATIDDLHTLLHEYSVLEKKYSEVSSALLTLYSDAVKLEAENDFMIRLINSYNKDE